jgi:alpha-2-macroglobulin
MRMKPNPAVKPEQKPGEMRRMTLLLLTMMLLVSLACQLPGFSLPAGVQIQPKQASTNSVSQTAIPNLAQPVLAATLPANIPPVLVEEQPLPGSDLPLQSPLTFYFNQAMDAESVQRGLEITPPIAGKLEWPDPSTLRFNPQQPLPASTDIKIVFNNNVRSKGGAFIVQPVELSYRTVDPLQVLEQLPKPDTTGVNPTSAVVATFSQPLVPLSGETAGLPAGFMLNPPADGRGEWLNTHTYIYYPKMALQGGVKYSVQLNKLLTGLVDKDWSFTTALPKVLSVEPGKQQLAFLDVPITVKFNQPMDPGKVEANFSLSRPDGQTAAGKFTWNKDNSQVDFQPEQLLERDTQLTVKILAAAQSQSGTPLNSDVVASFQTVPALALISTKPAANEPLQVFESSYGLMTFNFNAPLAEQKFLDLVSFSPDVVNPNFSLDDGGTSLTFSGYLQPDTTYTVTLSGDLKDRWGQPLGKPELIRFTTTPAVPSFNIPMVQAGSNVLFVTSADASLAGRATNLTNLDLTSSRLSFNDFVSLAANLNVSIQLPLKNTWKQPLSLLPNRNQPVEVKLDPSGAPLAPGMYYYLIASPEITNQSVYPPSPFLVVVSDTHLTLKRSAEDIFIWAVNLKNNLPVAKALITAYDEKGNAIGTGSTDQNGTVSIKLPAGLDQFAPLYIMTGKPGEPDFSLATTEWNQGISSWDFGLPANFKDNQPFVYLYTDRPIYQPGQTVYFRAIARHISNGRYSPLNQEKLSFNLSGTSDSGQSTVVSTQALPLSVYGTAHGAFTLAADAVPGFYALNVDGIEGAQIQIQVAQYEKPEIDLQVSFPQAEQLFDQDISAKIKTAYYFGAPAGQVPINWTLTAAANRFSIPEDYQAGKQDTDWLLPQVFAADSGGGIFIAQGQAETASDGSLTIPVSAADLKEKLDPEQSYRLMLEVTAQDESRQPVSARSTVVLHPANFYVGVHPDQWSGQAKSELGFNVQTVDWQAHPSAQHKLSAVFQKVTWRQQDFGDPQLGIPRFQVETRQVGSTDFMTDSTGRARLAFTPAEAGTYELDVRGEGAVTQILIWVGGEGTAPWPDLPNQHIRLTTDANSYLPGQTARLFIPNPFKENTQALVTVERGKVMRWQVEQIQGASATIDLPILEEDAPNIYVSVVLLSKQNGRLDFRQGYLELNVKPTQATLQVGLVIQPQQSSPGGEANIAIQVKDSKGNPVQGEFSLALVDKAVLALTDPNTSPINDAFYGPNALGVRSSLSMAAYSWRIPLLLPGRGGGGGGFPSTLIRQKFEDTAYFNATLETDSKGQAQVSTRLPDNLTTWVADIRGVTKDTRTGEATGEIVTSKDLLIRPVSPGFFVVGDHVLLSAVVHNNTSGSLHTAVSIQPAGFILDDAGKATQQVDIPAGGRQAVEWWGTAQDVDAVELTFAAHAGTLEDTTRTDPNKIPVLKYSLPQTFGTSGVLADSSSRREWVALPRSFTPTGGSLQLQLAPSLASTIMSSLQALDTFPYDFPEAVLSRFLPNLEAYQAMKTLGMDSPVLREKLDQSIQASLKQLIRQQNSDGGWGWAPNSNSDPFITAYILLGLSRASQMGLEVSSNVLADAQKNLAAQLALPPNPQPDALDQVVFEGYALSQSGAGGVNPGEWYNARDTLSPWSKALLALILQNQDKNDIRIPSLLQSIGETAVRSANGVHWENKQGVGKSYSGANFVTAVVLYSLAQLDPASPLLTEAVRYLVSNRQSTGAWFSTYDTAWAIMAMTQALKGTGDLQANYPFSASLNGAVLLKGQAGGANALNPVSSLVPLDQLKSSGTNQIQIERGDGSGRLYYQAFLEVDRPIESAPPVERGISITRSFTIAGPGCDRAKCQPTSEVKISDPDPILLVRLSLTLAHDVSNLVVEDSIPAGTEILNAQLKTSQQNLPEVVNPPEFDPADPFGQGWGWWLFHDPQIYTTHIRWMADSLPAGTYQLTYRLVVVQPGEYRLIPARAFEYYSPDVQGSSAGGVLTIRP